MKSKILSKILRPLTHTPYVVLTLTYIYNATWEETYAQSYNNGYNQGVSDTKAMNNILTVAPESVVTIWNGVLAPIFRYDVFGVSIGSIFAGLVCLGGVFLIITKVL